MQKYFEINEGGHNIRCKLYYQSIRDVRRIVVFCHGFAGHKDTSACEKFAGKLLKKHRDAAVLAFDWPGHGDDVKKKLILQDCLTYLETVVRYCQKTWHTDELYAYATSFGGYLVLRSLPEAGNPFRKIALRCPAVNMYESLTGVVMRGDEAERIRRGETVAVGFDRKIGVGLSFLNELAENDIRQMDFLDFAEDILILHGTRDEVIPFEVCRRFAEEQLIELIPVENADHRFINPDHMDLATKRVFGFFGF